MGVQSMGLGRSPSASSSSTQAVSEAPPRTDQVPMPAGGPSMLNGLVDTALRAAEERLARRVEAALLASEERMERRLSGLESKLDELHAMIKEERVARTVSQGS